jgi:hypothetical protein
MGGRSKLERLVASFDCFYGQLADVPEAAFAELRDSWQTYKETVVGRNVPGVRRSQLAAGLEQGLRELPLLLDSMTPETRKRAAVAYASAIKKEHPEFFQDIRDRFDKIVARGRIRGEAEFHLVRSEIDFLEARGAKSAELDLLYELIDDRRLR